MIYCQVFQASEQTCLIQIEEIERDWVNNLRPRIKEQLEILIEYEGWLDDWEKIFDKIKISNTVSNIPLLRWQRHLRILKDDTLNQVVQLMKMMEVIKDKKDYEANNMTYPSESNDNV